MTRKETVQTKLAAWGVQDAPVEAHWNPNTGERFDNTWRVGEDLFFKVGTNLAELQTHIAVSKALAQQGFTVSLPVQTLDGKDYFTEGELCYSLSKRVDGTTLENEMLFASGGETLARKLGQAIGKLDNALAAVGLPCEALDLPQKMKKWGIPGLGHICTLDEAFYQGFLPALERLWPQLPQQIIHRDPNPGNVLVKNGEIVGFLDFELSEHSARICDPCYTAMAVLSESFVKHRDQWPALLHEILAGYDETAHLNEAEKEAIPYILFSIQITCAVWFSEQPHYRELAETNLQMLKWMLANRDKQTEKVL